MVRHRDALVRRSFVKVLPNLRRVRREQLHLGGQHLSNGAAPVGTGDVHHVSLDLREELTERLVPQAVLLAYLVRDGLVRLGALRRGVDGAH